jgi:hypothetical protein
VALSAAAAAADFYMVSRLILGYHFVAIQIQINTELWYQTCMMSSST